MRGIITLTLWGLLSSSLYGYLAILPQGVGPHGGELQRAAYQGPLKQEPQEPYAVWFELKQERALLRVYPYLRLANTSRLTLLDARKVLPELSAYLDIPRKNRKFELEVALFEGSIEIRVPEGLILKNDLIPAEPKRLLLSAIYREHSLTAQFDIQTLP